MCRFILIIIFIFILILKLSTNNKIRITSSIKWSIFFVLLLIVIIRPETMADYQNYIDAYNIQTARFEPFYHLIYGILHFLSQPYLIFFIIMACLTVGLKWYAIIRISDFPFFSLLIWIAQVLILQDMIAIRAALAASILLWIVWFKNNQKIGLMWISIFGAICCHYSAVLFLIIPFLSSTKPRKLIYLGCLGTSAYLAFIGFSLTDFFGLVAIEAVEQLNDIYKNQKDANAFNMLQVLRCILCILLWFKIDYLKNLNKNILCYLKLYTLGCIIFFLCWKLISVAFRFGELFWVTEIILYPYLMYLFGGRYKKIFKLIPILTAIVLFVYNFSNSSLWNVT